jgi:hypothetical protein
MPIQLWPPIFSRRASEIKYINTKLFWPHLSFNRLFAFALRASFSFVIENLIIRKMSFEEQQSTSFARQCAAQIMADGNEFPKVEITFHGPPTPSVAVWHLHEHTIGHYSMLIINSAKFEFVRDVQKSAPPSSRHLTARTLPSS